MKNFFLFLALINIAFLLWAASTQKSTTKVVADAPLYNGAKLESLRLIPFEEKQSSKKASEASKFPPVIESEAALEPKAEQDEGVCFELGSFNDDLTAKKVAEALGGLAQQIVLLDKSKPVIYRCWVVLPAASSWEQSNQNFVDLKNKNAGDMWLMPNGENKGVSMRFPHLTGHHPNKS
ncbi:MAG: hypothetical protein A6F71_02425 [Cycloclasticus sp. symbiont of Poecilosclerida sp. M]|nr:MAG: hypothetical protein A6F71_02425 [Cycloclasticus sp. symbiont of Poecilosclerida sp. M]